ncbi:hypothetical protein F5Y07DRAFT_360601 [Xylaria sp. FL0933]|nr:hypothetical protein F5Y07DRAFT_360601 [Xylaria sp. FL0933]
MSTQWIRAFRSAARNPRRTRLVPRPTRSSFHSTVPSRAAAAADAPRDDGRKPDEAGTAGTAGTTGTANEGTGAEAATGENFLGDNVTATNGENVGRKKPANGARSRPWRSRRSELSPDLPPVEIPKPFLDLAVDRHGDGTSFLEVGSTNNSTQPYLLRERGSHLFDAAAWSSSLVEETIQILESNGDIGPIMRRMDVLSLSAYLAVLQQVEARGPRETLDLMLLFRGDNETQPLISTPPHSSLSWVAALLQYDAKDKKEPLIFRKQFAKLLLQHLTERGEIPLTKVALYEPCVIDEVVTALRAEFLIRAPKDSRLASTCRPVTVINTHNCSGFSVAEDTLRYAAQKLGADVLHLRAHDIAYVVGRYIGQDITRAQGDVSLLGYRAAENCGKLKPQPPPAEEENEDRRSFDVPFTVMLGGERSRKDTRRQTVSMDGYLLNSGTRGKSDELWEDMKINAALDELVHSADVDAAEQKPLIIHINDFNAINMDETGATILSKIRKVVDGLWLSGRKVVLVGSCSTKDAPRSYQLAMKGLETSERVIHISRRNSTDAQVRKSSKFELAKWEKLDNLRENDENVVRMLWSMTESDGSISRESKSILALTSGLEEPILERFPNCWRSVLPMTEIYRIATTMISLSSIGAAELFSQDCFEKAVTQIAAADAARERAAANSKASKPSGESRDILTGMRKMDPFGENHEEKLMSGMVNAQDMRTTFKDIHAPQETIESIKMLTTLSLVRPEAFSYGVLASDRIPGCLLYGPPGTGKTLLAKAVAKESGANMIEVSGASINHMYVGESEKNVRALFRLAKKKQPMVIFIDEADALLGARGGPRDGNRRETINQFLREWDGMDKVKAFIMVATNRPFDLDEAVLRRLPRKLLIDLPLEADRASILKIHLKDELMDDTVSIEDIAKHTPLYSGSDLKNVCVAAAMAAVKEELDASERHTGPEPYQWAAKRVLSRRHFDKALKEIGASVSEDMATLTAIRKFDERYGDGKARKKRKGMGFEVVPEAPDSEQARVRSGR